MLFLGLLARGDPLPRRREWLNSIVTGAIFCGSNGLLVIGEQSVSSGLAAVVLASIPLWGALFAGVFGRWPSQREWAGLAAGFAGMVLLNVGADLRASPFGAIALLSSAAIWALSSTWSRLSFAKTRSREWTMGEWRASHGEQCPSYSPCLAP